MKNKSIKIVTATLSFLFVAVPLYVFSATPTPTIHNPLKFNDISVFINSLLGYVVIVGGVVATCAFIWAGFTYVKAQGNDGELTKAKDIFINTCYGTALLLGAQLISTIIKGTIDTLR